MATVSTMTNMDRGGEGEVEGNVHTNKVHNMPYHFVTKVNTFTFT
jgi:hypothetical protein